MTDQLPRLSTAQAAARLGVKRETLYAYVARGLISSARSEAGDSSFDPLEVESFAAARGRGRGDRSTPVMPGRPLMVLDWDLTLLSEDELYFRGVRATELADRWDFEDAVTFFWTGASPPRPREPRAEPGTPVRVGETILGSAGGLLERLTLLVIIAGSFDDHRHELAREAVLRAGRRIIALFVDASPLPRNAASAVANDTVAARLWSGITDASPSPGDLALLNAALVLCIDHDLAASTMAARVAASARADLYACVAAALSALSGNLHGSVTLAARDLIAETVRTGRPEAALSRQVAAGRGIPGFGHPVYAKRDPRAAALLSRMRALPRYGRVVGAVDQLASVVGARLGRAPNLDLALAALVIGAGAPPEAAQAVFTIGRAAGWTAHVLDEYAKPALRLRPESRYVGVQPRRA